MVYNIKEFNTDKLPDNHSGVYNSGENTVIMQGNPQGNIIIEFTNDNVKIYLEESLLCTMDISNSIINNNPVLSELSIKSFPEETTPDKPSRSDLLEQINNITILALVFMDIVNDRNIKKKEIKSTGYIKVKVPSYKLEYRAYEESDKPYNIYKNASEITVTVPKQDEIYKFPSAMYPFTDNNIRIFTEDNTDHILDNGELSLLLSDFREMPGKCFDTSKKLYDFLIKSGYTQNHKVEYMCGWIILANCGAGIAYHAFLLIDGKHIIDCNVPSYRILDEAINNVKQGKEKMYYLSRNDIVNMEKNIIKANKSFMDIYGTGKAYKNAVYIASEGTKEASEDIMDSLIGRYPNHPAFVGMKKNKGKYENKLHSVRNNM